MVPLFKKPLEVIWLDTYNKTGYIKFGKGIGFIPYDAMMVQYFASDKERNPNEEKKYFQAASNPDDSACSSAACGSVSYIYDIV